MDILFSWWFLALLSSIFAALNNGLNAILKTDGLALTFWTSFIQLFCFLPFFIMTDTNYSWFFWVAAGISGFLMNVMDIGIYNGAKSYGGAILSRILTVRIWLVSIGWFIIDPHSFFDLFENPYHLVLVITALILAFISLFFMNQCAFTKQALVFMIPIIIAATAQGLLFKYALFEGKGLSSTLVYGFAATLSQVFFCSISLYLRKNFKFILSVPVIKASSIMSTVAMLMVATRFLSFYETPNPGYIYIIASLSTVWLYIGHKMLNLPDSRNPWAGFTLVVSAILIIWVTT